MYENIYNYKEEIMGKSVYILFKPNFREEITLLNGRNTVFSDGEITIAGELNPSHSKFPDVYISEDAQWALEDEGWGVHLFVTERTKDIITPWGNDWNKEFNRMLEKAKGDYYRKKKVDNRYNFY